MAKIVTNKNERLCINGQYLEYELSHTIGKNSAIGVRHMTTKENSFDINDSKFYVSTEDIEANEVLTEAIFTNCHQFVYTEINDIVKEILIFNNSTECSVEKCIIDLMAETASRWNQINY